MLNVCVSLRFGVAGGQADYLVRRGVPFRTAHHIAGEAVVLAEDSNRTLLDLTAEDLKPLHEAFGDDVTDVWDFHASADSRDTPGGTGKTSVQQQIASFREWLVEYDAATSPRSKL